MRGGEGHKERYRHTQPHAVSRSSVCLHTFSSMGPLLLLCQRSKVKGRLQVPLCSGGGGGGSGGWADSDVTGPVTVWQHPLRCLTVCFFG